MGHSVHSHFNDLRTLFKNVERFNLGHENKILFAILTSTLRILGEVKTLAKSHLREIYEHKRHFQTNRKHSQIHALIGFKFK